MFTQTTTTTDATGAIVDTSEIRLFTLAELKAGDHEDIETGAYDRACEWLAQLEMEFWDGDSEVDWLCTEIFPLAGIEVHREKGKYLSWKVGWSVGDRGECFWIDRASVDTEKFLDALARWAKGEDIRGKEYRHAKDYGTLAAGPRYTWRLDRRRKEIAVIRDQGIVIRTDHGWNRGHTQLDWDYHYDLVSEPTMEAAQEMVDDLMHFALKTLRDDWEDCWHPERLAGLAEANEYTFDDRGNHVR